jgi:hypothetical protein
VSDPEEPQQTALRDAAEQRAIWAGALTAARAAPEVETFVSWVLGITGATFALLIGNLDKVVPYLGVVGLSLTMLLMLVSAYFGFIARFQAYQVKFSLRIDEDKQLEVADAYRRAGGLLKLRMDVIAAGVHKINSPDIDELGWIGRRVWSATDWLMGLPAPKPNLQGLEPEHHAVKQTAFWAATVLRCLVYQMSALFAAVFVASIALLVHQWWPQAVRWFTTVCV